MPSVLGISAFYHDSAACLVTNGGIAAAAHEERFTRRKHDSRFPKHAVAYCLDAARLQVEDLDAVVYYESPDLKFHRLLETWSTFAPAGWDSFYQGMRSWLGWKLELKAIIERELRSISCRTHKLPEMLCATHHASHAASAFFPSGFERSAVLCLDAVGEWATTSSWEGCGNHLRAIAEIPFPHSLGLLYSAFTHHAGFRVNSGEYKLMGLAPYGEPKYVNAILDKVIDLREDGSFRLDPTYFDYCVGATMTSERFSRLFGGPRRTPESRITTRELDLACSIQVVVEEAVVRLARALRQDTGLSALCLAGGVALNCVANTRILRKAGFERVWVQPAAGDAGGALGAALLGLFARGGKILQRGKGDAMEGALLGPSFADQEIAAYLRAVGAQFEATSDQDSLVAQVADALADGQVVGWFQGRAEFGPRALGARSILADPRDPGMQRRLNMTVKYRESFRPFAPSVPVERAEEYFDLNAPSPYMQFVANVRNTKPLSAAHESLAVEDLQARLSVARSDIPAVTHVNGTARLQTVDSSANPLFRTLLDSFAARTGCAVLINTSFNTRGEPIVGSPEDAYRCFMRTDLDVLAIGSFILRKSSTTSLSRGGGSGLQTLAREAAHEAIGGAPAGTGRGRVARQSSVVRSALSRLVAGAFALGLLALFLGAITPIACFRRLSGRTSVWRQRKAKSLTYWNYVSADTSDPKSAHVHPMASGSAELAAVRRRANSWLVWYLAALQPLARTEREETEPPLVIYTMF